MRARVAARLITAVAARESVRAAAPENFSELYLDRLRKLHAEVLKAA